MRLSDEAVYQEFQSENVQSILKNIEQKLETSFTAVELKNWGGQGIIIYLECPLYYYKICAKLPHFKASSLMEAKHAILKEALINEALTRHGADYVPRLLCYSDDGTYFVREYLDGNLLDKEIRDAIPEERIKLAYLEWEMVTKAFNTIHENKEQPYVIRDLKAKNIILSPGKDKLFLIDLGSCRREDNMISRRKLKIWNRFGSGQFLHWPLEQLTEDKNKCSKKVDYFAFGVLMYETVFNYRPYTNKEKILSVAKKKYAKEYEIAKNEIHKAVKANYLPIELAELMIHTLHPEPENRFFKEMIRQ